MKSDRTILTYNHLSKIINCIQNLEYEINDFEFSTQKSQSYIDGFCCPTSVIYVLRISTRVEMSYIVGENVDFTNWICTDLKHGVFDEYKRMHHVEEYLRAS